MAGATFLSEKEREIINLATSLAAGCQPCMKYHLRNCIKSGWCENEIAEIFNLTGDIYTRAFEIMKSRTLAIVNADPNKETGFQSGCLCRKEILVGLAVSYTVNSTDLTEQYLACARRVKMSESEISGIIELSKFTWSKARAHVELFIEGREVVDQATEHKARNCGCGC